MRGSVFFSPGSDLVSDLLVTTNDSGLLPVIDCSLDLPLSAKVSSDFTFALLSKVEAE